MWNRRIGFRRLDTWTKANSVVAFHEQPSDVGPQVSKSSLFKKIRDGWQHPNLRVDRLEKPPLTWS